MFVKCIAINMQDSMTIQICDALQGSRTPIISVLKLSCLCIRKKYLYHHNHHQSTY